MKRLVVKVGGSLLDWTKLPERLEAWLDLQQDYQIILIAGGGAAADWVRKLDREHGLGDEKAHRLAFRALDFSADVLGILGTHWRVVDRADGLSGVWSRGLIPILKLGEVLQSSDLPATWDVTSDSIAAKVAESLRADRLILLKSTSPTLNMTRQDASRVGLVDPYFPEASRHLTNVFVVNLRSEDRQHWPLPQVLPHDQN